MKLPTTRAAQLAPPEPGQQPWLIEGLWSANSCGIVGGEPKIGKTFLALDLAVSVASGAPCLRRFQTPQAGRVLLFAAEDAPHVVRGRLQGIAHAAGIEFESLDIHVITVPTLRLDRKDHQQALQATVAFHRPHLTVLDPFVRLHAIDENIAAEVAPLLAYLRSLQRNYRTAIALVHHARKGAAHERGGQALRGSSDLPLGVTPIFICGAMVNNCSSASSIALLRVPTGCCSHSRLILQRSPWRFSTKAKLLLQPRNLPAWNASNRSWPKRANL